MKCKECKGDDWELIIDDIRRGVRAPLLEKKLNIWQCRKCKRIVAATDKMYQDKEEI